MAQSPHPPMPYSLGLPFWGFQDWVGNFYRAKSQPKTFLSQYASVFDTVEGNTTFYSLPSESTVERWIEATPPSFRFCFKLPRQVTHEGDLGEKIGQALFFLERVAPLGPRLGPFMVQLPASVGPRQVPSLRRLLTALPAEHTYAVELRHADFYASTASEDRINRLLLELGVERCLMDTRAMRTGDLDHPDVISARHKKPDLPVRPVALGNHPIIRMVGHPEAEINTPWIEEWAEIVAHWIHQGRHPFFMVHVPNNLHAPPLAARFHERLGVWLGRTEGDSATKLPKLPPFPAQIEKDEEQEQLSLF